MPEDMQKAAELEKRQADVEQSLKGVSAELLRITTQAVADNERFKLIEQKASKHELEIKELRDSNREMQRSFDQLNYKIDNLDTRLFSFLQKISSDSGKERQATQKLWITFTQFVLGGTVFAIVAAFAAQIFKG